MKKRNDLLRVKRTMQDLYRTAISQYSRLGYLRLDKNENPAHFDKATFRKMLKMITPDLIAAYPEPHILYNKLAEWQKTSVENVIVCNGSDGAIKSVFELFVNEGDEVLVLDPTYAMYDVYIKMFGARRVGIKFDENFSISQKELLGSIHDRTALVAIANPNSPTGTALDENFLVAIAEASAAHRSIFLVDEAYYHFYPKTMSSHINKFKNLIVTRTFSKAVGMASARLGYAFANKGLIREMFKVRPMYEVNGFAVKLGEFIIDNPWLIDRYVREEKEGKIFLTAELKKLGFDARPCYANFVLVKVGGEGPRIYEYLKSNRILIAAQFNNYLLKNFIRFTTGPRKEMEILIKVLKKYCLQRKRSF